MSRPLTLVEQRDESDRAIHDLLIAFEREISSGYSTPEQQAALRNARAILASHGCAS